MEGFYVRAQLVRTIIFLIYQVNSFFSLKQVVNLAEKAVEQSLITLSNSGTAPSETESRHPQPPPSSPRGPHRQIIPVREAQTSDRQRLADTFSKRQILIEDDRDI